MRQEVGAFLSTYFRIAPLQLPLPGFPQQPHQLSYLMGQGGTMTHPKGLFPEVKSPSIPSRKVAKRWERRNRPSWWRWPLGTQEDPALHCSKPTLFFETSQTWHVDMPPPPHLLQLPQGKKNLMTTWMANSQAPLYTPTSKQKQNFIYRGGGNTTPPRSTSQLLSPFCSS